MNGTFKTLATKCLILAGLFLSIFITTAGSARAIDLTAAEKYWLTHMREEEKLARDVYTTMYNRWGYHAFNNIAASEQKHMDAVNTLLIRYGVPDPAADKAPGEFTDPDLQALYNKLILDGSVSLIDALKVGVDIEETDIADLNEAIAATRRKDIKTVYGNLLQGSLNHLKAFVSSLASYGVTYEP